MTSESFNLSPREHEKKPRSLYDYSSVVDAMHEHDISFDDILAVGYMVEDWSVGLPAWANIADARKLAEYMSNPFDDAEIEARQLIQQAEQTLLRNYWGQVNYVVGNVNAIIAKRQSQLFMKVNDGSFLPIESVFSSDNTQQRAERYIKSGDRIIDHEQVKLFIDVSSMSNDERVAINSYMSKLEISPVI